MIKLWKATVNNWGWDSSRTFFFKSHEVAQECVIQYPASDPVQYAGAFNPINAAYFLGEIDYNQRNNAFQCAKFYGFSPEKALERVKDEY
jgi:hypothetical protein